MTSQLFSKREESIFTSPFLTDQRLSVKRAGVKNKWTEQMDWDENGLLPA
jgi:hypothetical protein